MKKYAKLCITLCFAILLCIVVIICMRGGKSAISDTASDTIASESETPEFLNAAVPVAGSENLSEIHTDFLAEGEYSAAMELGGNLLLVRMYVPESVNDTLADAEEWEYEENFCYQFDLYSLKENAITASLNTEDVSGDSYQIVGSELYLIDYEENLLRRYDANLSPIGTYDATELMNTADCFLYASSDADTCYVIDYENHTLLKVTFTENNYTLSECATDYYCSYISMSSPDASKLLLHTVDKDTFLSGSRVVNTSNLSDAVTYSQDGFSFGTISDDAFLTQTSDGAQPYISPNRMVTMSP